MIVEPGAPKPALSRDFRLLWSADFSSQLGNAVQFVALPLIAATVFGAGPLEMGLLAAAGTAPNLVIGLPAGVWVDRVRRRPLLRWTERGQALVLASVPLAWWAGVLTMAQLYVVAVLSGALFTLFEVASQSYLPALVGRGLLPEANSRLQTTRQVIQFSGRPLGGLLAQLLGATNAVVVCVLGFVGSTTLLSRIRGEEAPPGGGRNGRLTVEVAAGLRFLFRHWLLRPTSLCVTVHNFFLNVYVAVSVLFLVSDLKLPEGVVGLLISATGAGGILGGLTVRHWATRFGKVRALILIMVATTPFRLLVPFADTGWALSLFVLGVLGGGYGTIAFQVLAVSLRQTVCPDDLLGRVNASARFLTWGAIPLGSLTGGALGALVGLRPTMWVAGVGMVLSTSFLLVAPMRLLREAPEEFVGQELRRDAVATDRPGTSDGNSPQDPAGNHRPVS
ncbi:MFS transporter [Actinoalloteichus spitiensis]|uniref:MFS transporter n=1 Tax=Actinoalloteichus spitiensis TaxID=252394 RepID=UPI000689C78D|nr:MFS transporter [Actinoalloteichus spitiensis]